MNRPDVDFRDAPLRGAPPLGDSRKVFDFIIAGGGVSGLSLAMEMIRSPLRGLSILIIEPQTKDRDDRTLCFWTQQPSAYDEIVFRSWDRLRFAGDGFEQVFDLGKYRYNMLRGIDFYRFAQERLSAVENVQFVQSRVDRIEAAGSRSRVWASGQSYTGKWVFDSRFRIAKLRTDCEDYRLLRQHFKGWIIETPDDRFDPEIVTFLDFRTPQKGEPRFFYVLPFSGTQALVECVFLSHADYGPALEEYIHSNLGVQEFRILAQEGGVNPLTDFDFARRLGPRVMAIGTAGGRVKPTSGYAFTRIQKDSAAIVQSLVQNCHPFGVPANPGFFRLCDAIILKIMDEHGDQVESIFARMFKANTVERVFHFLDEVSSPVENLRLIASLAQPLFVRALFEVLVSHKLGRWQNGRKLHGSTKPVSASK